ncbi:MAG: hypothetical protein P1P89_16650 [Desulfobacterales bacterium]|nr:hypothetical protein [Desulfobacterales bacterium]
METGSYKGDTVEWATRHFEKVFSIELSAELHRCCIERFKGNSRVHLMEGNSTTVLNSLMPDLREKCFFWLDAHFSSRNTACGKVSVPLLQELDIIGNHPIKNHIIVIDDLRLFGWKDERGLEDWGDVTIEHVTYALRKINDRYRIFPYNDTLVAAVKEDLLPFTALRLFVRKILNLIFSRK